MKYVLKNNLIVTSREAKVSDAEAIVNYMNLVTKESSNLAREPEEFILSIEDERKYLDKMMQSKNNYILTIWHQDTLISTSGIHGSDLKRLRHKVHLGMSVRKEYHNLGVGTLAMNELIQKAKELGKVKIELEVREDNHAAIKIYKRAGFEIEGVRKNGFYSENKFINLIQMGRIL